MFEGRYNNNVELLDYHDYWIRNISVLYVGVFCFSDRNMGSTRRKSLKSYGISMICNAIHSTYPNGKNVRVYVDVILSKVPIKRNAYCVKEKKNTLKRNRNKYYQLRNVSSAELINASFAPMANIHANFFRFSLRAS